MRPLFLFAILGLVMVLFQNCGNTLQSQTYLDGETVSSFAVTSDCEEDTNCVAPEAFMWLKIKENELYKVNLQTMSEDGHFMVGGTCATSTFTSHMVEYRIVDASTNATIGFGELDDICDGGRFQAPIDSNAGRGVFVANKKYILTLELFGLGNGNAPVSNPMGNTFSQVEVIFEDGL